MAAVDEMASCLILSVKNHDDSELEPEEPHQDDNVAFGRRLRQNDIVVAHVVLDASVSAANAMHCVGQIKKLASDPDDASAAMRSGADPRLAEGLPSAPCQP